MMRLSTRTRVLLGLSLGLLATPLCGLGGALGYMTAGLPGASVSGPARALDGEERHLSASLERDVHTLATEIGARHLGRPEALEQAARYVEDRLTGVGLPVTHQTYTVRGRPTRNVIAELPGTTDEIVVIGAHYDTAPGTPGADDNATGVAALLALAETFADRPPAQRTLRFVAFTNEEPPWFHTEAMGSRVYADACAAAGDEIVAMLSLETMGYYSDAPGSQFEVPPFSWFYPSRGNFLGFISDLRSKPLLKTVIGGFRSAESLASEGAALPHEVPGVTWSDHASFWRAGYPAVMVTDTAPNRNPHYHEPTDTPETLDFHRFTLAVVGLRAAVARLIDPQGAAQTAR